MTSPELIAEIRHQLAPTVLTWDKCSNHAFCGERARGGRECIKCLSLQLTEECGDPSLVASFISYQKMTFALESNILEKSEVES